MILGHGMLAYLAAARDHLWAPAFRCEVVKLPHAERTRLSPEARRLAGVNTKKTPPTISTGYMSVLSCS
jgi:hypothetical protein